MTIRHLPAAALAGAIILSACGSDGSASPASTASPSVDTATSTAAFNDADVTFAQGMIPHHQQAVEMADIALDPTIGASDQVRDIATRIKAAQGPEIDAMTGWLTVWGRPMHTDMGEDDMAAMNGMMSTEEMDALGQMTGSAFDEMWMEMMIRHHQGAIAMAQTAKASGSNPEVLAMADQVISAQQAEITEMQGLLG